MQEHPVPQDITGYQFHIIGNMTIKQFAEVGVGCFLGFLVYLTNLFFLIKWPLIALFVGAGVVAAFVPIEERPFDVWVLNFFKAMYKPTKFFWKRVPKIPDVFMYQPQKITQLQPIEVDMTPARKERIREFIHSVQTKKMDAYDQYELQRADSIINTFTTVTAKEVEIIKQIEKPSLQVRVREMKSLEDVFNLEKPEVNKTPESDDTGLIHKPQLSTTQVAQDIDIPDVQKVAVQAPELAADENTQNSELQSTQTYLTDVISPQLQSVTTTQETQYNRELPFPSLPSEPNKPVGMIITQDGHLIPNAIVEIQKSDGTVVRAIKTNSLGQFYVTTPLMDGEYIITAEYEGFSFPTQQLTLQNEVVQPIQIVGTLQL